MKLDPSEPLTGYRLADARQPARAVAAELLGGLAPWLIVRRERGREVDFHVCRVDDRLLLALLDSAGDVDDVLGLGAHDLAAIYELGGPRPRPLDPVVVLDDRGTVRGLLEPTAAELAADALFPQIGHDAPAGVAPDQVVQLSLELSPVPIEGVGAAVSLAFGPGQDELELHVSVSSDAFVPVGNTPWTTTFRVDRTLTCTPSSWAFQGRAVGDRRLYPLMIAFRIGGASVGHAVVTFGRRGVARGPGVVHERALPLALRPALPGQALAITLESAGLWRFSMFDHGALVGESAPTPFGAEDFFDRLDVADSYDAVRDVGYQVFLELPQEVTAWLRDGDGGPLHVASNAPVIPLEVARLRPDVADSPLLGEARPVTRWIHDSPLPAIDEVAVTRAACIRPDYGPGALPSAADEERTLREHFPVSARVGTRADFEALLAQRDVRLVHFAGHADGNPARLRLEDGNLLPTSFRPDAPLLQGAPFLFLNGCRAGIGRADVRAGQANLPRVLLRGTACAGLLAPFMYIDSPTARDAARTFYAALRSDASAADAILAVRRTARDARAPRAAATLLSYALYAPPSLRIGARQA